MLLQAHSFIVFLHPNAAMQRQLIDLNPFHETECQTAVVQEEARGVFYLLLQRFIQEESLSSWLLMLKRLSECDYEKCKSNFMISFQEPSRWFHLTSLQQPTNRAFFFIYTLEYNQKRLTSYGISHNACPLCYCLSPVWLCVVVYPAVLAGSGSAAADGIVLTVRQAMQTKLNQDNFLLVFWGGGGRTLPYFHR